MQDISGTAGKARTTFPQWTTMPGHTSVDRAGRTYFHQLCVDTGYYRDDLPRAMVDRDGWTEKRICWLVGWFGFMAYQPL